jgi:hypothetical protein
LKFGTGIVKNIILIKKIKGSGKHSLIGTFITCFKELNSNKNEFQLTDKNGKASGLVKVGKFKIVEVPNFLQYLYDGLQISLLVSIDFTGSNGHPSKTNSLHYRTKEKLNDYQKSIIDVGNIVLSYDDDGILFFLNLGYVPAFGFGAKFKNGDVSFCFPLNTNNENPECRGKL